jgi:hypothetical protein
MNIWGAYKNYRLYYRLGKDVTDTVKVRHIEEF